LSDAIESEVISVVDTLDMVFCLADF